MGVVFEIPGGSPHFGFLDVAVAAGAITVYGGGYESDPNTPIVAGVPEPGSLTLLAMGAAGLVAWRRRKNDQNAAAGS
ncbi:MAG: PEP-CTERM sorting domain-containing protein [Planctomycetota bacterium]|nr:MAG: PEP-CTERM sorting domain-containing protein [Planctomycetota bacterium]